MPTYEYKCQSCGHLLEEMQKITADPLKVCPKCTKETLIRKPGGGIGLSFSGSSVSTSTSSLKKSGGCCPCGKGNGCSN